MKNNLQELIKIFKNSQKPYLTDYDLLIGYYLWQAHYQILLLILLELIKLNVNIDTMIKNVKLAELNTKVAKVFFNT